MTKINLNSIEERIYCGVPDDIAERILEKDHTLSFAGFTSYIEKDNEGKTVKTFNCNEWELYREGLI